METQRMVEPIDFIKMAPYVLPKDENDIYYEERVRKLLAQNQSHEQIYKGITVNLSHLASPIGTSYQNSIILNKLVRQAISLKNHLKTHVDHKNPDSKILLGTLRKTIRLVTSYQKDIADLPFDWVRERFLPSKFRGWKLSYPKVESWIYLFGTKPEMKYVPFDDDDCETVNASKTAERPLKDPLCIFNLATTSRSVLQNIAEAHFYVEHGLIDNEENLPDAKELKIWLEFKEFDKRTVSHVLNWQLGSEGINPKFDDGERQSIEVDHPIVSAVGNFAVAAFNKACKKHVKNGEDNNLHGFEFTECKYLKVLPSEYLGPFYYFYMIIEAIEEGNPGTYMAEVICNSNNGAKLLCKFFLTDYRPSGLKAMAVSYFYCLESLCKTVDDLCKEKQDKLKELFKHLRGPERAIPVSELRRLRKCHAELQEVLLVRCVSARLLCPPDFDRMTNPDVWCDPVNHHDSGMVPRAKGTSCSGYDYKDRYMDLSNYRSMIPKQTDLS